MDALQDVEIYDNDRQVMALKTQKITGIVPMTQITVYRHVLVVVDDNEGDDEWKGGLQQLQQMMMTTTTILGSTISTSTTIWNCIVL